jgi:hypothetical protein
MEGILRNSKSFDSVVRFLPKNKTIQVIYNLKLKQKEDEFCIASTGP